jgi:glucose-6-phosphate dehydrogenase assembly protein OpcA
MAHPIGSGRRRHWRQQGVSLDEIQTQLARMTSGLAWGSAGGHPAALRTGYANLLIRISEGEAQVEQARLIVKNLVPSHPLRVLLVDVRDATGGPDAEVICEARQLRGTAAVLRQEVLLTIGSEPARHLVEMAAPLLIPGAPVFVWWMGSPPLGDPELLADLEACDALVIDLDTLDPLSASARTLAELCGRLAVIDLAWPRLRPYRETLAGFFAPPDRRPFAYAIEHLEVEAASPASGSLMVGWMASLLAYKLVKVKEETSGQVYVSYRGGSEQMVDVRLLSGPRAPLGRLSLRGAAGGRAFELELRVDHPSRGELRFQIERAVTQGLALSKPDTAQLLSELLIEGRSDVVYPGALSAAADLLGALR